jgi:recombination protein RecA
VSLADDIAQCVQEKDKIATRRLSELPPCGVKEWVSTGSTLIDGVIGRPGVPVGRLTAIVGKPGFGKTTLTIHLMANAQRMGALVIACDTEGKLAPNRVAEMGVDLNNVLLYQQLYLEQVFALVHRVADVAIGTGAPQPILFVVDSHSGTPTKNEVDAEFDADRGEVASSARITSFNLRRLVGDGMIEKSRMALIFVCQPKENIGAGQGFGPVPETYIAERPINFHSSLILQVLGRSILEEKDGIEVKVRCTKSQIGPPFGECKVRIMNEGGIDECTSLLEVAIEHGLVKTTGGGYYGLDSQVLPPGVDVSVVGTIADGVLRFRKKNWKLILDTFPTLRRELFGYCSGRLK